MLIKLDEGTNQGVMLADLLSAHLEHCQGLTPGPEVGEEIENCQTLLERLDPNQSKTYEVPAHLRCQLEDM